MCRLNIQDRVEEMIAHTDRIIDCPDCRAVRLKTEQGISGTLKKKPIFRTPEGEIAVYDVEYAVRLRQEVIPELRCSVCQGKR